MGGGGVMRAAAKIGGIGALNGGFRGGMIGPPVEQPLRNASRPVSTVLSTSNSGVATDVGAVHPVSVELEDWELAGGEEDPFLNLGEPLPRVVFGGAPSLEEAKEATADLKDALEKVYLMPSTYNESSGSIRSGPISGLSLNAISGYQDANGYSTSENKVAVVPQTAMKAFVLLNESPAVQSVVASIACDPKVWDAVMQNESLVEFLQSQKTNEFKVPEAKSTSVVEEFQDQDSPRKSTEPSDDSRAGNFGTMCSDALKKMKAEIVDKVNHIKLQVADNVSHIKLKVVDMVSRVSSFLPNIFGIPSDEKSSASSTENPGFPSPEKILGGSFMGLAVLVIMVAVLKRV